MLAALAACSSPPPAQPSAGGGGAHAGGSGGARAAGSSAGSSAGGAANSGGNAAGGSPGGSGTTSEAGSAGTNESSYFPEGALSAVTLTYDDGLDPHIATVGPALAAQGLKGTFFLSNFEGVDHDWALPNLTSPFSARHQAWQAMAAAGHELAGHTVNHPCDSGKASGYLLTDYDMARMATELDSDVARLARLNAGSPLTFAYPCASDEQGIGPAHEDYSPLVATRFFAARVSDHGIADPATVDLLRVPQQDAGGKSGDELRAMVDQAIAQHGWLVILFHGVGSEQACSNLTYAPATCMINYLVTSEAAHSSLVTYLGEKKSQVWTATFKEVAQAIKAKRP